MTGFLNQKVGVLILIFGVISFFSCKSKDASYMDSLIGTWDVYTSKMNSKPNGFMKDGYFTFHENQTVESNIFEESKPLRYVVKEGRLTIESNMPFDLNIGYLTHDSLYLEGIMSHYYMEYFLSKRR